MNILASLLWSVTAFIVKFYNLNHSHCRTRDNDFESLERYRHLPLNWIQSDSNTIIIIILLFLAELLQLVTSFAVEMHQHSRSTTCHASARACVRQTTANHHCRVSKSNRLQQQPVHTRRTSMLSSHLITRWRRWRWWATQSKIDIDVLHSDLQSADIDMRLISVQLKSREKTQKSDDK